MEKNVRLFIAPQDQVWLDQFPARDRPFALAFIHYKRVTGDIEKKTKPQIFMEAFELGMSTKRSIEEKNEALQTEGRAGDGGTVDSRDPA